MTRLRFVVMEIDGIFVPFMVTAARSRGTESQLITLDGIDSDDSAAMFIGMDLFAPTSLLMSITGDSDNDTDDDSISVDALIGYRVIADGTDIGEITDIDDSTPNTLFIVTTPEDTAVYIPVADDFITEIDVESGKIFMDLPEGLISL